MYRLSTRLTPPPINPNAIRVTLLLAAVLTLLLAVFQVVLGFNADWSRAYGAPPTLLDDPTRLLFASLLMSAVFGVCSLYALAGAGYLRPLPLLRPVLFTIGLAFVLRAVALNEELAINLNWLQGDSSRPTEEVITSTVALIIGLLYLLGVVLLYQQERVGSVPRG